MPIATMRAQAQRLPHPPSTHPRSTPPSPSLGRALSLLAPRRDGDAFHLGALHRKEAFVISVAVQEEHDAGDVVVHAAPPVPLGHFLQLGHANAVILRRSLKDTLVETGGGGTTKREKRQLGLDRRARESKRPPYARIAHRLPIPMVQHHTNLC